MRTQFDRTRNKLIDECIETLKKLDCCEVEFLPADAKDYHDALIRFSGPWGEIKYAIEAKQSFSGPKAAILIHKLSAVKSQGLPILLFADYVPEELAEDLRKNKIEFVDSAGNAYLSFTGGHTRVCRRLFRQLDGTRNTGGCQVCLVARGARS